MEREASLADLGERNAPLFTLFQAHDRDFGSCIAFQPNDFDFRPPADGLYWLASIVAAIWGAIWVAAPIVVAVRQMVRTDPRDAAAAPPAEVQPNRS